MRSTLVSAALVLVVAAACGCRPYRGGTTGPAAAAAEEPVRPSGLGTRAVYTLPNGLRVVLEENHAAPVVALQAWVHAGASADPPGGEGLAHLFQHLLFLSTRTRAAGQTARDAASIGARIGAWTTYEDTVFQEVVASPHVDAGVRTLADLLTQPLLSPADIETARRAARDDVRQAAVSPDRVAAQAALATAFPAHPYGRPLLGLDTSLASLLPEQVRSFFDTYYGPRTTTLVVVGDFDPGVVRDLVSAAFGGWVGGDGRPSAAPRPSPPPSLPASGAPEAAVFTADIPSPQLTVSFRIPGARGADLPALELIAALLGPRRGGRLEMEIVRNRQLATAPRAYLFTAHDGGLLITTATLGSGRPDEAARAVRDEILRLAQEPVGSDELRRARTIVEGDGAVAKSSLAGYARKLGMSMAVAGDPTFEATYLERLRKVDAGDLKDVAGRFLRTSNLVVSVVLPAARDPRKDDRAVKLLPRLRTAAAAPAPVATPGAPAAGPVAGAGRDVATYVLPAGVRLLVLRDDTAPQLSVRAVWSGGVRLEDTRLVGAAALLARLLPRATKTRNADTLAGELADVAGSLDGVAGIDSLALRGDFLAAHWERGLELLVDCLRNPRLADDEIERERRVLLDALRSRNDDPTELALRLFQGALFGRHPYRHDLLGTPDSVAALTRRRLLDHFRQHYPPRRLTLAVVGPIEPDRVATRLQSMFADAPAAAGGAGAPEVPPAAAQAARSEPREVFQFITKKQARLVLGYAGLTLGDADRFALEVLAQVLGGAAGRLSTPAWRDLGIMPEQSGAVSQEGVDPGYFAVYVAAAPEAIDAIVPALRTELRQLVAAGVTDDEVTRARRILIGTRALALERRGAVAMALALHGAFGGGGRSYRREIDDLARVTAADVARVARRVLDPSREVLAVVRPRDSARLDRGPASFGPPQQPPRYTLR